MQILFAPTVAGARVGSLVVTDSAATSPQSLALTGMGVDFAVNANGSTAQTIAAGKQAVYPLLLTSMAGVPGNVLFACAGAPAYSTCVVTPSSVALGGTTPVTVTVATNIAAVHWPAERTMVWFAMVLPVGLIGWRRRRMLGVIAMVCCVVMLSGCMASRIIPLTGTGGGGSTVPTPSGTYNLTVSGTSAGLSRSVGLTLIVQ
jgi:hypothetical protein